MVWSGSIPPSSSSPLPGRFSLYALGISAWKGFGIRICDVSRGRRCGKAAQWRWKTARALLGRRDAPRIPETQSRETGTRTELKSRGWEGPGTGHRHPGMADSPHPSSGKVPLRCGRERDPPPRGGRRGAGEPLPPALKGPRRHLLPGARAMSQRRSGSGPRADMAPEIAAAVGFISSLLRTRGCVSEQQLQVFSGALREALAEHYKHHWFPEKPFKGSGYRCIRINHKMDPIISKAASQIGLSLPQLYQLLPSELTLWVDPYEVSYRIGEDGSICVLYEATATKPVSSYGMLTCKNQMMLGRTSPSKNYIMTVSS
uniref:BTG anti-proliferation factor 2 n=17 Tax=Aves TaxID=8782 RepID=A0A8B9PNS7_APTOW